MRIGREARFVEPSLFRVGKHVANRGTAARFVGVEGRGVHLEIKIFSHGFHRFARIFKTQSVKIREIRG